MVFPAQCYIAHLHVCLTISSCVSTYHLGSLRFHARDREQLKIEVHSTQISSSTQGCHVKNSYIIATQFGGTSGVTKV